MQNKKRPKYGNHKVNYDGKTFDSQRERDRYIYLKAKEDEGVITELKCQPEWCLIPPVYKDDVVHLKTKDKIVRHLDQRGINYKADFSYIKNGEFIVEDVKISKYLLPKEYILKEKMMYYFHKIRIKKIYKPSETV